MVSGWLETSMNRKFTYQSRTEFYNGTGTQRILLKSRPVYPYGLPAGASLTMQVWTDASGFWGSASGAFDSTTLLTYGTDWALQLDSEDGTTSKCGILVRLNNYWFAPQQRQTGLLSPFIGQGMGNVKVTYDAGFTVDTLPPEVRLACTMACARLRYVLPLGVELSSESYEERSISIVTSERDKLLALVKPMLTAFFRNFRW